MVSLYRNNERRKKKWVKKHIKLTVSRYANVIVKSIENANTGKYIRNSKSRNADSRFLER